MLMMVPTKQLHTDFLVFISIAQLVQSKSLYITYLPLLENTCKDDVIKDVFIVHRGVR